jgi:hypothetical protein
LPPELAAFASLLDAQPAPARDAFRYCLALAMVEAGKARLVETVPGENGPVCVFESSAGERFRPEICNATSRLTPTLQQVRQLQ